MVWTLKCEVRYYFFKSLETALVLTGHNLLTLLSEHRRANTPSLLCRSFPISKQPLQIFSQCVMRNVKAESRRKKMKSQKHRHRNKWFLKALHHENSLRYDITSQQKRCFTNLDSWMKLNIFSASLLDLDLSDSLHTDGQMCSTPHLSAIYKEQQYQQFSYKNVVAFWVCQIWLNNSKTIGCAPHLPYSEHGSGGFTGCLQEQLTLGRTLDSGSLHDGNFLC